MPHSLMWLRCLSLLAALACTHQGGAREARSKLTQSPITPGTLKQRLEIFASDSMEGRQAGTIGNVRGTTYLAAEARRLGLEPAGENGTYFQRIPLIRRVFDERTSLAVSGRQLQPWTDYLPRDQGSGSRSLDGVQTIYGGSWRGQDLIAPTKADGRLVILTVGKSPDGELEWGPPRDSVTGHFHSAAGIAVASLHLIPDEDRATLRGDELQLPSDGPPIPTYMYVTADLARDLLETSIESARPGALGRVIQGNVAFTDHPSRAEVRNVIAVLRGRDPGLREQYIALGAHNDHVGMSPEAVDHDSVRAYNRVLKRKGFDIEEGTPTEAQLALVRSGFDTLRSLRPVRADSVYNGADDDGSGSVLMFGIAEALARREVRPRRSILFVWHSAEELGALGSRYLMDHPTVQRDSIVAQLNLDAVGRGTATDFEGGGPTYLQLIGPERLSAELANVVKDVNAQQRTPFVFDRSTDAPGHPDQVYCRSDHMNYSRYGIPVAFFFAGFHFDFHHVTDEAQYIDYVKLARVGTLVHDITMRLADLDHRLRVDGPKPDPSAECVQ